MGQACFAPGEAKNTYGTGCFLLMNTGEAPVASTSGLVTTVAWQLGEQKPCYALEGSIAVTGALVQWLRDNLGLIKTSAEVEIAGGLGAGQRRRVFRAGIFRPLCAVVARRCAWRDRRADALCHRRSHRARRAGGDRLPDARRDRGDAARLRHSDQHAARRWRHGGERAADAVPGRHAERAGAASAHHRDHRAGCRLCGGTGRRLLARYGRSAQQLGRYAHWNRQ